MSAIKICENEQEAVMAGAAQCELGPGLESRGGRLRGLSLPAEAEAPDQRRPWWSAEASRKEGRKGGRKEALLCSAM